jgi:hypothetical protein
MQTTTVRDLQDFLDDDDWRDAFGEAMGVEPNAYCTGRKPARRILGYTGSDEPFTRADVARIIAISDGVNDECDWIGLFELRDGRFGFVRGGCDYTGWDCRAWGDAEVGASADDLIRLAMNDEERVRLGFAPLGTSQKVNIED